MHACAPGAFSTKAHCPIKLFSTMSVQLPSAPLWPWLQQNSFLPGVQMTLAVVSAYPGGHCVTPYPRLVQPCGISHIVHSSPAMKCEHCMVALFTIISGGAGAANAPLQKSNAANVRNKILWGIIKIKAHATNIIFCLANRF